MSGYRTIVVNERIWKYKIGKQFCTATAADTGERKLIDFSKLTGIPWNEIERGQWKRWFHITPKHIAEWLKGNC